MYGGGHELFGRVLVVVVVVGGVQVVTSLLQRIMIPAVGCGRRVRSLSIDTIQLHPMALKTAVNQHSGVFFKSSSISCTGLKGSVLM